MNNPTTDDFLRQGESAFFNHDFREAERLFILAANQNSPQALIRLGDFYFDGIGVYRNYQKAAELYTKAMDFSKNPCSASEYFRLGLCYEYGVCVEKSDQKSFECFEKAQSNKRGAYCLANCYIDGCGVEKDSEKACEIIIPLAQSGYARAQNFLAWCYEKGEGIEQSYEKAIIWYSKAAEQGYSIAQRNLGEMFYKGKGVEESHEKAANWFTKAANLGDVYAQYMALAIYSHDGKAITNSFDEKTVEWLTKAAEQGDSDAECILGEYFLNGQSTENAKKAITWLTKAAKHKDGKAQFNLAECYENGKGVEIDIENAIFWYRMAMESGFEDAQDAIDRLEKEKNKLILAEKKDVFLSWNHEDEKYMNAIKTILERGGCSVWDSNAACVGKIDDACISAIQNSQAWVIIISNNSLKSEWVRKEIAEIFKQIGASIELKTCLIPFFIDNQAQIAIQELEKNNPNDIFLQLNKLGGIYGLQADGERVVELVRKGLSCRKIIEYRKKSIGTGSLFNAFISTRVEISDESAEVGLKCKIDSDYINRTVINKAGEKLSEKEFVKRLQKIKSILLYAQGGAGKSLYIQNLIFSFFSENRYIFKTTAKSLAEYLESDTGKKAGKEGLLTYFVEDINKTVGYGYEIELTSFYGLIKLTNNKIIFVIDAIDELGGNEELRQSIRKATVLSPVATEENVHFLFTSRRSSDGVFLGVDESYELEKFSRKDGYDVAKRVFNRFAQKYNKSFGKNSATQEKPSLSDSTLYFELDKLREDIAANPLLVTNFVILFVDHLTTGSTLPKNDYEIAERSVAFLLKDVERDRLSITREVDKKVLECLDGILCDLAFKRATNDTRKTTEIFCEYLRSIEYDGNAKTEAERLYRYLRSRAIVVGEDKNSNVYHAIFQAYLTAKALYFDCYTIKRSKLGTNIIFGTLLEDGEEITGKEILAYNIDEYFRKNCAPWTDVEPFLVAELDKNIFDLSGVSLDKPLKHTSASYQTLQETLSCLYETENDKKRYAYQTLYRMLDARSVYNIEAIRTILGI